MHALRKSLEMRISASSRWLERFDAVLLKQRASAEHIGRFG